MQQGSNVAKAVADRLRAAFASRDVAAFGALLDPNVRWGGAEETPETCHTRAEVLNRFADMLSSGVEAEVIEATPGHDAVLLGLRVRRPVGGGAAREHRVYQVMRLRRGLIADIRGYPDRAAAAAEAGLGSADRQPALQARAVIPILNVSDLAASFRWFGKLGWTEKWTWCDEADGSPTFGAVESGEREIFLSLNGQGPHGMWLAIWVDDVDAVEAVCVREGLEVIRPPQDEPWGVREMHVRHPDGHVLRISQAIHTH